MFNIDFDYLIEILLPTRLRKLRFRKWLKLILSSLNKVYSDFKVFTDNKLFYLNFTSQRLYLEKKLQTEFNTSIFLSDGNLVLPYYLHNIDEIFPQMYVGNLFVEGKIYQVGNEIIYNNYFYKYNAIGNGNYPDLDTSAERTFKANNFIANQAEYQGEKFDFYVNIPLSYFYYLINQGTLTEIIEQIKGVCEYYKFIEKTYQLRLYE